MMACTTSSARLGRDHHFEFDLGQQIHVVFLAAIDLFVAFLPAVAANFGDGHAVDADLLQGGLDLLQLERLNDRFDLLSSAIYASRDVAFFAVLAEIQALDFLVFGDAQADREIADLEDDRAYPRWPGPRRSRRRPTGCRSGRRCRPPSPGAQAVRRHSSGHR